MERTNAYCIALYKALFFNKHFACQLSSELQTVKYIRRSEPKCVRIMKGWALKDKLHIWLQWFFDYRSCSQHHPVTDESSNKPTLYAKFTYLTLEQNYSNSKMTWLKKEQRLNCQIIYRQWRLQLSYWGSSWKKVKGIIYPCNWYHMYRYPLYL